jgi:hypothetical protein
MRKALENRGKIRKAPRPKGSNARRRMAEAVDLHLMDFEQRSVPLVFQENRRARRIILRLDYGASRIVVVLMMASRCLALPLMSAAYCS